MRKIILLTAFSLFFCSIGVCANNLQVVYGPTLASDDLWSIASQVRPSQEVSVQQVMLSLLRNNRKAFNMENVNALTQGHLLKLPAVEQIKKISKSEAEHEVAEQNHIWHNQAGFKQGLKIFKKPVMVVSKKPINAKVQVKIPDIIERLDREEFDFQEFSRQIQDQIADLQSSNNVLKAQILVLGEHVNTLEEKITKMELAQAQEAQKPWPKFWNKTKALLNQYFNEFQFSLNNRIFLILIGILVGCLLLLIWSVTARSWKKKSIETSPHDLKQINLGNDDQDSYDPMSEEGGIAAKINLARAYIDMGNTLSAKALLDEIIATGDQMQKEEAKKLAERLPTD